MSIKRLTILALLSCALSLSCLAEMKQGPCTIPDRDPVKDGFVVEVGDKVRGKCEFVAVDFMGRKIIRANIEVKNTADVPMHFHYYAAFFDKDGQMLGCTSEGTFQDDGLKPGGAVQYGSCLILVPHETIGKVASYKVAFYESKTLIGK